MVFNNFIIWFHTALKSGNNIILLLEIINIITKLVRIVLGYSNKYIAEEMKSHVAKWQYANFS